VRAEREGVAQRRGGGKGAAGAECWARAARERNGTTIRVWKAPQPAILLRLPVLPLPKAAIEVVPGPNRCEIYMSVDP
jgi:hypothetical protein